MTLRIERAAKIGFCFGVRRAIDILERVARERGGVETFGAVVHNQQVLRQLAALGVRIVRSVADIRGDTVAISTHGVAPQLIEQIRAQGVDLIDTTCPFVKRAQVAARRLAESGFYTVVYGDVNHPEVKGILGWAGGKGVATVDGRVIAGLDNLPRRLGVLSQTHRYRLISLSLSRSLLILPWSKTLSCVLLILYATISGNGKPLPLSWLIGWT